MTPQCVPGMMKCMDYNLTIMAESSDVRARRRLILISIILATIPCYCLGFVAWSLSPNPSRLTQTPTITGTPTITPTGTVATPTTSGTPLIITSTVTNTLTLTPTPTLTSTLTFTPSI